MGTILNIEAVIAGHAGAGLTRTEVEDLLAIGYLAMRADGRTTEDELDALERASRVLLDPHEVPSKLMAQFAEKFEATGASGMLESVVARLERTEARELAYKLAYAMSLSDLDTNDDEFLFEDELREALGIAEERAEALIDDVIEAIEPQDGDEDEGDHG